MGADRAKRLWERAQWWLAVVLVVALVTNASVVLGETVTGGIAVAAGLAGLIGLGMLAWRIEPKNAAAAVGVAALTFVLFGSLVALLVGSLKIPPFDEVRFDQFDTAQGVLFGLLYGGTHAWARWKVFEEMRSNGRLAAGPERPTA